ncbi:hypothetical protein GCM10023238_28520 [Streptomyces heliomycini]
MHEAVAEALGEVDAWWSRSVQADRLPLAEGGGAGPDVHDHVEDRAAHALDVLGLAGGHVGEVDAAQGAPAGDGHVGLGERERVARRLGEDRALNHSWKLPRPSGKIFGSYTQAPGRERGRMEGSVLSSSSRSSVRA